MFLKLRIFWGLCRNGNSYRSSLHKFATPNRRTIYISKNKILFAQPTPETHSHLLKEGDITPSLSADVFKSRRMKFLKMLPKVRNVEKNNASHLVLIQSASVVYMSENIPYPFRQLSDFLYLCGYKEPNSVLVMSANITNNDYESVLFIPKPTAHSERWEGVKMSLKETTHFLGVDRTLYIDDLEKFLQSYAKSNENFTFWYDFSNPSFSRVNQTVCSFMEAYRNCISVETPRAELHKCRLLKCKYEAELMRKTCRIGAEALKEVIKYSNPSILESHLQAKFAYECCLRGADHLAFPPVIAGGPRANTIHYIDNNQVVNDNEMVLMDAGCEFGGYSSDLARTWPVNGRFSDPQRELYDLILSIQEHLIQLCAEKPSLDYLFKVMCCLLGSGLQNLGILPTSLSKEAITEAAYNYCPHHVSHYLGMDVHDTNTVSRGIKLLPGMVVTVEPGIYISMNDSKVPERYRGICIRIEDDVLITKDGVEVLTSSCPKHADEIEKLIQS